MIGALIGAVCLLAVAVGFIMLTRRLSAATRAERRREAMALEMLMVAFGDEKRRSAGSQADARRNTEV